MFFKSYRDMKRAGRAANLARLDAQIAENKRLAEMREPVQCPHCRDFDRKHAELSQQSYG